MMGESYAAASEEDDSVEESGMMRDSDNSSDKISIRITAGASSIGEEESHGAAGAAYDSG